MNERTFLPVLVLMAPSATLLRSFPGGLAETLEADGVRRSFINAEINAMETVAPAKTHSRQPLVVLNEFARRANYILADQASTDDLEIAMELSQMPI